MSADTPFETLDKEPLKEYSAMLVAWMIEQREKKQLSPCMALLPEMEIKIVEDMKDVLRELCREKVLKCHLNINGKPMFEFNPTK